MVEIMGHAMGQGDAITFSRADAEFHALLIQAAGQLDARTPFRHRLGRPACLRRTWSPAVTARARPRSATTRIVDALASGDSAAAESAMRQLLVVHPDVERVVPAPREH
ncbi:GntR family transcriptional regulator OS=Streptomyces microflavus OX=1919 GN=Smic_62990 PE=4 SV=1 [Streptomyces microflavus]